MWAIRHQARQFRLGPCNIIARSLSQATSFQATPAMSPCKLEDLNVENTFVEELPGDSVRTNTTRQVHGALWSYVEPTPADGEPKMVVYSKDVCKLLGLDPSEMDQPEAPLILSGSAPLPNGKPYAQCYGGHQFGSWAGQLGDGRAISIGEVVNAEGERWELQLKGAGPTPYSRFSDGRAVLRSSIREYVASESFPRLGIPTTRALSLVATGAGVARDMFYNGNVKIEPGAIVCRVSPSFIRFGTFQLPVSRGDKELAVKVADYVLKHFYPHLDDGSPDRYTEFLQEVVDRTTQLVVKWQLVGFVHGVLNTDNMSVLGLTIDFGPYGFMDKFDPFWTPNLTDASGRRYSYKGQLEIVQWNLAQFATALIAAGLVEKDAAQTAVNSYAEQVVGLHDRGMAKKLGLQEANPDLTNAFLRLMYDSDADFTNTFRALSSIAADSPVEGVPEALAACLGEQPTGDKVKEWEEWLLQWKAALKAENLPEAERRAMQDAVNPCYVPRQHLLQYAIDDAERGDYTELNTLMRVLSEPYTEQAGMDKYRSTPPPDMVKAGISMLSCSS